MSNVLLRIVLLVTILTIPLSTVAATTPTPEDVGRRLTLNLLEREHMFYPDRGLHYAEACAAVGALWWAAAAGDSKLQQRLVARYTTLLDDKHPLVNREPHVDQAVVGMVPLEIYRQTRDEAFLRQGLSFADRQWDEPREDGLTNQTRWWIDDMYMVGMLQMQAFRVTGDARYAERAARFMAAYLERLQQDKGLFFHGPDAPIFWGRGNGWVAVALAEVLDGLPQDDPRHGQILDAYRLMMATLLPLQSDNGMWRQILDNPHAWAESSATAMFAYAMALGLRQGWLDATYAGAVDRAWEALVAHLDPAGNLREVGVGTGQSDDLHYYLDRDRVKGDFHGQAPMLWLVRERMLLAEKSARQ